MSRPDVEVLVDVAEAFEGAVDVGLIQRAVRSALDVAADDFVGPTDSDAGSPEVSVRVTDDAEMHRLNFEYRSIDAPTDVLSFSFEPDQPGPEPEVGPAPDIERLLGEVVLSYPWVQRQAEELGHSLEKELAWLTIHGTLQLAGYTHESDRDAARMEALEQKALASFGLG